jgi:hypothetical protein
VGKLAHWSHPGSGTSPSGISTTVAWELPARAGASNVDGAAAATVVIATAAATTACCTSTAVAACRTSVAAAVYRASAPSLSVAAPWPSPLDAAPRPPPSCPQSPATSSTSAALLGRPHPTSTPWQVRGGHGRRHPANTKTRKLNPRRSNTGPLEGRSLTSGWRSRASSSLRAQRAPWAQLAWPPLHPQTPPRGHLRGPRRLCCGARPRRLLSRRLCGFRWGAWAPTSRGEHTPRRLLPPPPPPTTNLSTSPGERVPAAHAAGTPHLAVPDAHAAGDASPSCAPPAPAPAVAPYARAQTRGEGGLDRAASTAITCEG